MAEESAPVAVRPADATCHDKRGAGTARAPVNVCRPGPLHLLLPLVAGLASAPFLPSSPWLNVLPLAIAAIWFPVRRRPPALLLLTLFFLALGISFYFLRITPPVDASHVRAFRSDRPVTVEGTVLSLQPRTSGRWAADLEAKVVSANGIAAPVRGRVRLQIAEGAPAFQPGDRIRFRSRLQTPRAFGTPGEFDYPRYLAFRGIFITAYVPAARDIAVFPAPPSALNVQRWRSRIGQVIDRSVPPERAPLLRALVIGDKGGITPEQRTLLSRGGVSHLFSISGLHLGLIALFLYHLARFAYCRSECLLLLAPPRRLLPILLIPFLLLYLLLTGDGLPTRRAFLMAAVAAGLLLASRRTQPLKLLAAAAFLILLAQPLAIFEPSFQLSFAGVLGIMVLLPRWQGRLQSAPRPVRWTALLWLTTLAASVTTAPLVLLHFHLLAPAGLLTNLAAVPAIGFAAVPLGLLGALCVPWCPSAAALLFQAGGAIVHAVFRLVELTVALPGLGGWTWYPSPLQLAAAFLITAAVLCRPAPRWERPGRLGLLAVGWFLSTWSPPASSELTVTSLSVGQGDATLLSLPAGRHFLVDGGGLHSPTFDIGERLVAPALGRLGVSSLEAVILTHDHPDHRQGLVHVLEHFPVRAFWSAVPLDELHPSLQIVLRRRGTPVRRLPAGWTTLSMPKGSFLSLFTPAPASGNLNDASLVVHAGLGNDAVLLTGDLEAAGVANLLSAMPQGEANLLKLPHHGSRRSQPELLLDRFRPQAAFVSAGAGNPYRFPHQEVVVKLTERGIRLFRTDTDGTVRFRSAGGGWSAERWERGLFH